MALGRGGILANKREGDGGTPRGIFHPRQLWWRADRHRRPVTLLPTRPIRREDAWCENPADRHYNRPIRLDREQGGDRLTREDHLYDFIVEIDHNAAPRVAGDLSEAGARAEMEGELSGGYYVQPTIFRGDNSMRIFQEEIFGPVVSTTTFTDFDDAMRIANDTLYGLGAGVWSRNGNTAYRAGRAIQAGRVWVNNYHAYPAHAAFGGYKSSGIGRENHLMMLDHYQQTKNLLVSYSEDKLGFF